MTEHHPLTDNILISRFPEHVEKVYSPTFDHIADAMRAAADWQLERVVDWLKTQTDYPGTFYYETPGDIETLGEALKSVMRPQTQLEDN